MKIVASNEAWLEYSKESCFRTYNKKQLKLDRSWCLCATARGALGQPFQRPLFVQNFLYCPLFSFKLSPTYKQLARAQTCRE